MSEIILQNIKSPQSARRAKKTSLSYLYEIAAIPENIRIDYMQRLHRRKNSSSQKNVRLLNIIYHHIKKDRMLEWNEVSICRILNISKNMLYCHKSRILKSLRLLYFNWKEIEKEELSSLLSQSKDKISFDFLRIQKMSKLGMWRETKNELLKLERVINAKAKTTVPDKIILAQVCKLLVSYYYQKENTFKFNLYYKKSVKLCAYLAKHKAVINSNDLTVQISILINYLKIHESYFKLKSSSNRTNIIRIFNRICTLFKKHKDKSRYASALLDNGILYFTQHRYKKALERFTEGRRLSEKHNLKAAGIVFQMYILLTRVHTGELDREYALTEVLKNYDCLEELNVRGYLKERALHNCNVFVAAQEDTNLFYRFLYEYNCHYILTCGYNGALSTLYSMKFGYYQKKIKMFRIDKYKKEKIPVIYNADPAYKQELINTANEVLQNFHTMRSNRIKNIHFKWESLLGILETEFWKGTELNYNYALHVIQGIDWLKKAWGVMLERDTTLFPALKLCIDMIEDSKHLSKPKLLNKFEFKFRELSVKIADVVNENVVGLYSIFSYTAQLTGYKELKNIMANVYLTLRRKYPEKFQPLLDELRQKKNESGMAGNFESARSGILIDKAA